MSCLNFQTRDLVINGMLLTAACPPSLVAQAWLGIGSSREELISSLIVMLSEPLHLKSAATPDHECGVRVGGFR